MLATEQDESTYEVRSSSYVLSLILLLIPPAMLYQQGPALLDGSIEKGELIGLCIGVLLPLLSAYYMVEFASFRFSLDEDVFRWRWHNFIRRKSGSPARCRWSELSRCAVTPWNPAAHPVCSIATAWWSFSTTIASSR
jgi:hypothetical protein